ncbi:hypothetical protein [Methylobacterium trifolii]|uniref:Uncharacterized protein n=1 Tax=Methylobacterium trifolii TaxID=1003092 RepID=A0ABQ4U595_9HYPH|nr:hypothetical protein [Methylobacterium trifolii]GJE62609.1 hypothetical protein MPOCJGCO_4742 [Methylobacterium trifolii]
MKGIAAFVLLCLLIGSAAAQGPLGGPNPPNEQRQDAQKPESHKGEAKTPQSDPAPAQGSNKPPESRADQEKRQETAEAEHLGWAKRAIADFIEFADRNDKVIVAIATVLIAAFTVILGIATVFLWLATRALVRGADQTAERQLRAYLLIDGSGLFIENGIASFKMRITNAGQTPANNISVRCFAGIGMDENSVALTEGEGAENIGSVGPRLYTELRENFRALTVEENQIIYGRKGAIYFRGAIKYVDVFGKSQTTNFSLYFGGRDGPDPNHRLTSCRSGNDMT